MAKINKCQLYRSAWVHNQTFTVFVRPFQQTRQVILTKVPHAFLVRVVQEKVALFNSPVDLKAKP